jgi:hypothetical protein
MTMKRRSIDGSANSQRENESGAIGGNSVQSSFGDRRLQSETL